MTMKIEMFSSVQSKGYNSDGSVIIWFDKQTASCKWLWIANSGKQKTKIIVYF